MVPISSILAIQIQRGGDIPTSGLRMSLPDRPKGKILPKYIFPKYWFRSLLYLKLSLPVGQGFYEVLASLPGDGLLLTMVTVSLKITLH